MTLDEEDKLFVLWHLETGAPHKLRFSHEHDASELAAKLNSTQYLGGYLGTYVVMTVEESRGIVH